MIKNWLKDKWQRFKKEIIWFVIGGTAIAAFVGDIAITTENEFINILETEQTIFLQNGHYKHIPFKSGKIKGKNVEYIVHEYETAKEEVGYQIIIKYPDRTKSIGYGVEAQARTFEISHPPFTNSTSTSQ